jgi:hypothetical protein
MMVMSLSAGMAAGTATAAQDQPLPPCGPVSSVRARARALAPNPPMLVQMKNAFAETGGGVSATFAQPATAGNLIVAYLVWDSAGSASLSDSSGNEYAPAGAPQTVWNNGHYSAQVFYAKNIAGGATTVTAMLEVPASSFALLYVHEYSGLDRDRPLYAGLAAQGASTALSSGELTFLKSRGLLFGAGASIGAVDEGTPDFTIRTTDFGNVTEDRSVDAPGIYSATGVHGGGGWAMSIAAFTLQPVCEDTQAPSVPTNLTATALSDTEVQLTWSASTDDTGLAGYNVYRNGIRIARSTTTSFRDAGLIPNSPYSYSVSAFDDLDHTSPVAIVDVQTQPAPPPTLEAVDGGVDFYARFANPLPSDPTFFPIGVWFESVMFPQDVDLDKAIGLNTYVELTGNTDLSIVRAAGMHAIHSGPTTGPAGPVGEETKAWLLTDEADMWGGPGHDPWTGGFGGGNCIPIDGHCGYTVMETLAALRPADGRMRYANYGKGVTFWETDAEAAQFVNNYQDLTSADNYWFTDGGGCSDLPGVVRVQIDPQHSNCAFASNYGWTVQRVRNLIQPAHSRPVWAFVEVGHPFSEPESAFITPSQVRAAVWHSLIAGARGIIYFNHTFGDPTCWTDHVLRDIAAPGCYTAMRAAVGALNARIAAFAPILNAPTATTGWSQGAGTRALVKWWDGHFYVIAGAEAGAVTGSFSVPCVGNATATVLDEDRSVPVVNGTFTDAFADGNAIHLYRLDGGSSCGLP